MHGSLPQLLGLLLKIVYVLLVVSVLCVVYGDNEVPDCRVPAYLELGQHSCHRGTSHASQFGPPIRRSIYVNNDAYFIFGVIILRLGFVALISQLVLQLEDILLNLVTLLQGSLHFGLQFRVL